MATPMTPDDLRRIAAEVSIPAWNPDRRGRSDDGRGHSEPACLPAQAVADVLDHVQLAVRDFEAAADKVQVRAGGVLAQEVRECGVLMRQEFAKVLGEFRRDGPGNPTTKNVPTAKPTAWIWLVIGLALALALLGLGFLAGNKLR